MVRKWFAGAVFLALTAAATSGIAQDTLAPGETLSLKDRLFPAREGPRGSRLAFDRAGDLVLYFGGTIDRWRAGVGGKGAVGATLRADGEFVVTDAAGAVLWSSGTKGFAKPSLRITDFGDLEIFSEGRPIWEAGRGRIEQNISGAGAPHKTVGDHLGPGDVMRPGEMLVFRGIGSPAFLKFSPNGRLGLYAPGDTMRAWLANTRPAALLEMRREGNLVLTEADGKIVWQAGNSQPGSTLSVDSSGISIAPPGARPVWSSDRGVLQQNIDGYGAPHRNRGDRLNAGQSLGPGEMLANRGAGSSLSIRLSKDGGFGVFGPGLRWGWRPAKRPGKAAALVMDRRGDLTLKTAEGYVLWRASGGPGAYAFIDTFSFSLKRADGSTAWSTERGALPAGGRLTSGQEIWGPWLLTLGKQTLPSEWAGRNAWLLQGPFGVRLTLDSNGELELRQDKKNRLLWKAGTAGKKPVRTTFQAGELALFDAADRKIFSMGPPSYPGAELQLGGSNENAGARIARSDGKTVWVKGNPFPDRLYRVQWDDIYMSAYADGGDGTPFIFGGLTVTPVGGVSRAKGHSNIFWRRGDTDGARVKLAAKQSYATQYPGEFANKHQEFVLGPGPKGDYAGAGTQGVMVSISLTDYDKWSANDPIGNVTKTFYFKDFDRKGSLDAQQGDTVTVSGGGISADFKFKLLRLK